MTDKKHYPNSGILFPADEEKKAKFQGLEDEGDLNGVCEHCQKTTHYYLSAYRKEGARGPFKILKLKPKKQQPQPAGSLNDFPSNNKGQQTALPLGNGPSSSFASRDLGGGDIPFSPEVR